MGDDGSTSAGRTSRLPVDGPVDPTVELLRAEQVLLAQVEADAAARARLLEGVQRFVAAYDDHEQSLRLDPSGSSRVAASLAVVLRSTEHQAHVLIRHARAVSRLDAGLALFESWTVEQVGKVLDEVADLAETDPALADQVVEAARSRGPQVGTAALVRTVRRVRARLTGEQAADRRRKAEAQRRVEVQPLPDGQAALWVQGPAPDIHRMARAIRAHAEHPLMAPFRTPDGEGGVVDDRTLDNVRFDALLDLLTGRGCGEHSAPRPELVITIPVDTALDRGDEPAALCGAAALDGPVDAAWVREQLRARPHTMRPLPVDAATGAPIDAPGRPVRSGTRAQTRALLLDLVARSRRDAAEGRLSARMQAPPGDGGGSSAGGGDPGEPRCPDHDNPGTYRVPRRLRRQLQVRSPRCEWPGCHRPSTACDLDHDVPWPAGPTCACNLGPLCRHHHRTKQTGWTKSRADDGSLTWTGPTGLTVRVAPEHVAAGPPVRPLPRLVDHGLGLPEHLRSHDPEHDEDPPDLQAWLDDPPALQERPDPWPDSGHDLRSAWDYDPTWSDALDDPYLDLPHPAAS